MYGYIYLTTNTLNGKIYVGQHKAEDFESWYLGSGIHIRNAVKKYGRGNFSVKLIDTAESKEELNEKEVYWIKELDSRNPDVGYNLAKGGAGHEMSGDSRKRMSEARKRYCASEAGKEQLSKLRRGRRLSEETKLKLSRANKGRVKSEEERKRLSEALKGNKYGFCSPSYKHKEVTEETKKKLSESHKGLKQSDETRARRSESMKKAWQQRRTRKEITE